MLLIPLDNRPVCYDMPLQIAKASGVQLHLPPKELMGGLTHQADFAGLKSWVFEAVRTHRASSAIIALDTLAYGGLVPSRWSEEYYDDIISRVNQFLQIFKIHNVPVTAFSSIMRIANSNNNEEEKDYWCEYGEKIFKYSNLSHKLTKIETPIIQEQLDKVISEIPQEILEDYISSRERNFDVNLHYLEKVKQGAIDYLVLCQDDTSKWGLNVVEAESLKSQVNQLKLHNKVMIHPGTDEVASVLFTRCHMWPSSLSVYPIFTNEDGKELIAHYEDRPIKKSVEGQIKLAGAKKSNSIGSADLILLVHLPEIDQGDHIFNHEPEGSSEDALNKAIGILTSLNKPITIADILWANGSDPELIKRLFDSDISLDSLYGYAGWNTASNSIGSALAMGISKLFSEKEDKDNKTAHRKLLLTRFLDDWAYQANVRQQLSEPNTLELAEKMKPFALSAIKEFKYDGDVSFSLPWERKFEVEIALK